MIENKITGLMIYYYYVCKRKLWLSYNELAMESENENVSMGKFIDENSYKSERKHIMINNEINIDFVKRDGYIHEVKKSRKIEEASIWQVKYYLLYLEKENICGIKAKIDYPLLKKVVEISLNDDDRVELASTIERIKEIINSSDVPKFVNMSICTSCAYEDLCRI